MNCETIHIFYCGVLKGTPESKSKRELSHPLLHRHSYTPHHGLQLVLHKPRIFHGFRAYLEHAAPSIVGRVRITIVVAKT